jgi:hypothetical protein
MTNTEQFAQLYGPPARHSDHTLGEVIAYYDAGQQSGKNSGRILYVAAATAREPLRYIVSPDIGVFPVEVAANEVRED